MYTFSTDVNFSFGIYVNMIGLACDIAIYQFNTTYFDDTMTVFWC